MNFSCRLALFFLHPAVPSRAGRAWAERHATACKACRERFAPLDAQILGTLRKERDEALAPFFQKDAEARDWSEFEAKRKSRKTAMASERKTDAFALRPAHWRPALAGAFMVMAFALVFLLWQNSDDLEALLALKSVPSQSVPSSPVVFEEEKHAPFPVEVEFATVQGREADVMLLNTNDGSVMIWLSRAPKT